MELDAGFTYSLSALCEEHQSVNTGTVSLEAGASAALDLSVARFQM